MSGITPDGSREQRPRLGQPVGSRKVRGPVKESGNSLVRVGGSRSSHRNTIPSRAFGSNCDLFILPKHSIMSILIILSNITIMRISHVCGGSRRHGQRPTSRSSDDWLPTTAKLAAPGMTCQILSGELAAGRASVVATTRYKKKGCNFVLIGHAVRKSYPPHSCYAASSCSDCRVL